MWLATLKLSLSKSVAGLNEINSIRPAAEVGTVSHNGYGWADHGPPSEISEWRLFEETPAPKSAK